MHRAPIFHIILAGIAVICLMAAPALSAEDNGEKKGIAVLDAFSGEVRLKHRGTWGAEPQAGMFLYHGDKIVTGEGTCRVVFHDGSVLDVHPHTNVRIAEIVGNEGFTVDEPDHKREIRLLLGKVKYKSGDQVLAKTRLVAPTAVAALRGTEAELGTDGDMAFLRLISGEIDRTGDIAEGPVPDSTAEMAGRDTNYQRAREADQIRKEYVSAVKALLMSWLDRGILLASADARVDRMLLAQAGDSGGAKATADRVLALGALYAVANSRELMEENETLSKNPDLLVWRRAEKALRDSRKALADARDALESAKEIARKIDEITRKIMSGDVRQMEEARQALKGVIATMMRTQKSVNAMALGKGIVADQITAGVVGEVLEMVNEIIRDADQRTEAAQAAQETAEAAAQRVFEAETPEAAQAALDELDAATAAVTSETDAVFNLLDGMAEWGLAMDDTVRDVPEDQPEGPTEPTELRPRRPELLIDDIDKEERVGDDDRDGDGFTVGQGDCDDLNYDVHPGAREICGDGIDNNCNGVINENCAYGQ